MGGKRKPGRPRSNKRRLSLVVDPEVLESYNREAELSLQPTLAAWVRSILDREVERRELEREKAVLP